MTRHIPRVVHQIWMQGADKIPAKYDAARESWKSSALDVRVWDEVALQDLASGTRWEAVIRMCTRMIQRADVYRCLVLETFGGLYADMDMTLLQDLEQLFQVAEQQNYLILGNTTLVNTPVLKHFLGVNNAFLLCAAKHPVLDAVWREFSKRLHQTTLLDVLSPALNTVRTTGPAVWSAVVERQPLVYRLPVDALYTQRVGKRVSDLTQEDISEIKRYGAFAYHAQDTAWLHSWEKNVFNKFINWNRSTMLGLLVFALLVLLLMKRGLVQKLVKG